jgi:hypothetical protein
MSTGGHFSPRFQGITPGRTPLQTREDYLLHIDVLPPHFLLQLELDLLRLIEREKLWPTLLLTASFKMPNPTSFSSI